MNNPGEEQGTAVYLHPIQLQFVAVRELSIRTYRALPSDYVIPPEEVHTESIAGQYNSEEKTIQIDARVYIGSLEEPPEEEVEALAASGKLKLRMIVRLVGQYSVDETQFPLHMLSDWASKGGAMILFPYVREHVYSLTARCGIRPFIFPVFQMPTIKVAPKAPSLEQSSVTA